MTHLHTFRTPVLALGLLSGASGLWAQSTVAELTAQGGSVLTKAQWLELLPLRIETQWPNRQGEEELFLSTDGKITGKGYHYSSRSESAASGSWRVEDDGKVCTPKTFVAWNNSTNRCGNCCTNSKRHSCSSDKPKTHH